MKIFFLVATVAGLLSIILGLCDVLLIVVSLFRGTGYRWPAWTVAVPGGITYCEFTRKR